ILFPVPIMFRYLDDGVDLVDDVFPEHLQIAGFREDAGHADDGDWFLRRTRRQHNHGAALACKFCQICRGASTDCSMKVGDSCGLLMHGGDLPDHVHAVGPLLIIWDPGQVADAGIGIGAPRQSLAGYAKSAEVHELEFFAHVIAVAALGLQLAPVAVEHLFVWRVYATNGMTGPRFQQYRALAGYCCFLELL